MFRSLFFSVLFFVGCQLGANELVLVSVAPYETMCKELTANGIDIELLVPVGDSLHTYEPRPKQVLRAAKAKLWFIIGEVFEKKVIKALHEQNPNLAIVDLRDGLDLMREEEHVHDHEHVHHHHEDETDPHIWMSPKMMQVQVSHMAESLKEAFPELQLTIEQNAKSLITRLEALDKEIREILKDSKGKTIFVSHPAYGYFCREYGLDQVSIEFEGKDPTPRQLNDLLEQARKDHVRTIFTQKQYSTKASNLIAQELQAKIVLLDPYSKNYFESMREIAKSIAEAK